VSKFLDTHGLEAEEVVPASRKLGKGDAARLAKEASRIIVAKGKKVDVFEGGKADKTVVSAMLGPTGNLRAPVVRAGKTILVGFDEESLKKHLL
jgi:hypothetical protein